ARGGRSVRRPEERLDNTATDRDAGAAASRRTRARSDDSGNRTMFALPISASARRALVRPGALGSGLIALAVLLGAPTASRGAGCDTSWAAPVSGNFDSPSMWTGGTPTIGRTACLPDLGSRYTVTIRDGDNEAASLSIAHGVLVVLREGPGGARLHTAAGVDNAGEIDVPSLQSVAFQ